eukprot:6757165-Pyramimonas_sp.AAC.1
MSTSWKMHFATSVLNKGVFVTRSVGSVFFLGRWLKYTTSIGGWECGGGQREEGSGSGMAGLRRKPLVR